MTQAAEAERRKPSLWSSRLQSDFKWLEVDSAPEKNQLFNIIWPLNVSCKLTVEVGSKISYSWGVVFLFYNRCGICMHVADFPTYPFKYCLYLEESSHPTEEICLAEWVLLPWCPLPGCPSFPWTCHRIPGTGGTLFCKLNPHHWVPLLNFPSDLSKLLQKRVRLAPLVLRISGVEHVWNQEKC